MVVGAWLCLLAPLAGALAITLAGTAISRTAAGLDLDPVGVRGLRGRRRVVRRALGRDGPTGRRPLDGVDMARCRQLQRGLLILVDPLALTMMLIVTGVGGLIVWYSIGYMHGEDEERRYFAYMALFVFSMLLLVQGGNLLLLLAGWGLVGLASYLLIGFDHHRPEAIAAAKKAFLVNAVGDALMALAFFLLIASIGTLDFAQVFAAARTGASRRRP